MIEDGTVYRRSMREAAIAMVALAARLTADTRKPDRTRDRLHLSLGNDRGAEAVEFALVLPILLTILFATITLGIVFYHYQMLIAATEAGCRYFASARGTTTTPATNTTTYVKNAASGLTKASVNVTFTVNGTACTDATTPSCASLLTSGAGNPAGVTATYPCSIVIYAHNYAPSCLLSQTITEIVE